MSLTSPDIIRQLIPKLFLGFFFRLGKEFLRAPMAFYAPAFVCCFDIRQHIATNKRSDERARREEKFHENASSYTAEPFFSPPIVLVTVRSLPAGWLHPDLTAGCERDMRNHYFAMRDEIEIGIPGPGPLRDGRKRSSQRIIYYVCARDLARECFFPSAPRYFLVFFT